MTPQHQVVGRHFRPRHGRALATHGVLRGLSIAVVATLTFGISAVAALGQRLDSNIKTADVNALLGPSPSSSSTSSPLPGDMNAGHAVNILVLGSDYRDAAAMAAEGKTTAGMRADTTILVHISADRSRVELVSIPRDSLVKVPACLMSNGKTTRAQGKVMINSAFATGWDNGGDLASAAACAGRTVQDATGIAINHFVVVEFSGFQSMVNSIGGVNICIPTALHDPYTGLNLAAGQQVLNGDNAFMLARARHGNIGDGSDIARIGNQQRLLQAIANQVLSRDVLMNPTKLVPFLSAATSSLTTDKEFTMSEMSGLAYGLRSLQSKDITFMTIPWGPAKSDPNRVEWTSDATTVWQRMAADQPITGAAATPAAPTATGSATPGAPGTAGATSPAGPTPAQTKQAGKEAFTGADVTGVCS